MSFIRLPFLILFFVLVGCANAPVEPDELDCGSVKEGMDKAQVLEVLGQPDSSEMCGQEEVLSWDGIRVALSKDVVINKFETDESLFYKIGVTASVQSKPQEKVAMILSNVKDMDSLIGPALTRKGYRITDNPKEANVVIHAHSRLSRVKSHSTEAYTYSRSLEIDALDAKNHFVRFWKLKAVSEGKTQNMDRVLPYLIIASDNYIEQDSANAKTFVFQNDPRVKALIDRKLTMQDTRTPAASR